jgi:hypothetical protein
MSCGGGHLGFSIDKKKKILFVEDHSRKIPAKCDFKLFSGFSE